MSNNQKFRGDIEKASQLAEAYDGTEASFKELFGNLEALEAWFEETYGEKLSSTNEKRFIEENFPTEKISDTSSVLDIASKSFRERIEGNLENTVYTIKTDKVILKAGSGGINHGNGSIEPPKFHPRLKELLEFLVENGIYMDDIIMIEGEVDKNMMRKKGYVILEIPRLNKQILVCDQIDEATFVMKSIVSRDNFYNQNKQDLQDNFGNKIVKIDYDNKDQWLREIKDALFGKEEIGEKINVRNMEEMRCEIMKIKTPTEWAVMDETDKKTLKIPEKTGKALTAIATIFGLKSNPYGIHKNFLELGLKIYGEDSEVINEALDFYYPERLKERIKKLKTAEEWIVMKQSEKNDFKIPKEIGKGLPSIATVFGIDIDPTGNHKAHLELGRKIYGANNETINNALDVYDPEKLKEIIKKLRTAEEWTKMGDLAKRAFKTPGSKGIRLIGIARVFGLTNNPISNHKNHLELGRIIFGEDSM